MCGIAAFSFDDRRDLDTTLLVKLLLAGLAERGEDACGCAWRCPDGSVDVVKRALPPHRFLQSVDLAIPGSARDGIVHVRDHTKGVPTIDDNNHPIRHGSILGVHNGIIQNDDELFREFRREREMPGMTVDSEAIFMLLDTLPEYRQAFEHLVGSYCTAFFDDRSGGSLYVVRGRARPLVVGTAPGIVVFASTRQALEFACGRTGLELSISDVPDATMYTVQHGAIAHEQTIAVQPFVEQSTAVYSHEEPTARAARELLETQGQ